jgi:hypothetical protein
MYDSRKESAGVDLFSEDNCAKMNHHIADGSTLFGIMIEK